MHPPVLLFISADSYTKPLLEQALADRQATTLAAVTTEEGLRILNDRTTLDISTRGESQGQICRRVTLTRARVTAANNILPEAELFMMSFCGDCDERF